MRHTKYRESLQQRLLQFERTVHPQAILCQVIHPWSIPWPRGLYYQGPCDMSSICQQVAGQLRPRICNTVSNAEAVVRFQCCVGVFLPFV